jgi:hypothetical protein
MYNFTVKSFDSCVTNGQSLVDCLDPVSVFHSVLCSVLSQDNYLVQRKCALMIV